MVDSSSDPFTGTAPAGIVVGIGLRAGAHGSDVLQLIDTCLAEAGFARTNVAALATLDQKQTHPALHHAATALGVPVLPVTASALSADVPNPSQRVRHHSGVNSVAEAVAMQFGPLVLEKHRNASVTCALSQIDQPQGATIPSAASAASTLSTSSAEP